MSHQDLPSLAAAEVVKKDAKNRAWRTFLQNMWVDIVVTVAPLLIVAITDARWTKTYWEVTAGSLAKTLVLTMIAYVYRFVKSPKVPTSGAHGQ